MLRYRSDSGTVGQFSRQIAPFSSLAPYARRRLDICTQYLKSGYASSLHLNMRAARKLIKHDQQRCKCMALSHQGVENTDMSWKMSMFPVSRVSQSQLEK